MIALLLVSYCCVTTAWAGGVYVPPSTVQVNGGSMRAIKHDDILNVSFFAENYEVGNGQYSYLVLFMVSANEDVKTIEHHGKITPTLLILRDPRARVLSDPDTHGLPDVGPTQTGPVRLQVSLKAPHLPGHYKILYNAEPFFTDDPSAQSRPYNDISQFHFEYVALTTLAEFSVAAKTKNELLLNVYLQLNGQIPGLTRVMGGFYEKPLTLGWFIDSRFPLSHKNIDYRYQLWPEDMDINLSEWSKDVQTSYSFLSKGAKELRVQARYQDKDQTIYSEVANYDFYLDTPFFGKTSKASVGTGPPPALDSRSLYANSVALLVGIWNFNDQNFPKFGRETIERDISTIKGALVK
jgi:hypothetical protein